MDKNQIVQELETCLNDMTMALNEMRREYGEGLYFRKDRMGNWLAKDLLLAKVEALSALARLGVVPEDSLKDEILAIHRPSEDHPIGKDAYCVGCWEACGMEGTPSWPCQTARVVLTED